MNDFETIKGFVELLPRDVKHLEFGVNHNNELVTGNALDELQDDLESILRAVKRMKEGRT